MPPPVPRKALNLKQKVEIIRFKDSIDGWSICKLADKFGIVDCKIFLEWFNRVGNKKVPISGPIIQAKALEVSGEIEWDDFKASSGWLESFKVLHNIVFKSICGQSTYINLTILQNIFNADEISLFYCALPDKTFSYRGESCSGGKIVKEHLTVLLCVRIYKEKLKPLVIGKSVKPRCFKGIDVTIIWVKKAWTEISSLTITNCFKKADFPTSEPPEIENELLPLPRNDNFVTIDSNLSTECSSRISVILDCIRTELNPVETDDEPQADDRLENSEIKTFENYSEALNNSFI
ncbi:hypothetical protein QTP88_006604 [Uroleucon formosanum]